MLKSDLRTLRSALLNRSVCSVDLVTQALNRIADSAGEGARTFLSVFADAALADARRADALYADGRGADLPLLGIPISIKDLFDVAGRVTTAGSVVLRDEPPAAADAEAVARLRRAGAVIVGRTNMTELAFSGLGLNPHYGTPRNPWDRGSGRIPGGSSSGAAVSVADGMCAAALGTDTGGSVRIPAALCGLVGFKPTQSHVPLTGTYPLSQTLDSIGPIGRSVADCELMYDVLSGTKADLAAPSDTLRFAVPRNYVTDNLDPAVSAAFDRALDRLDQAGIIVDRIAVPGLDRLSEAAKIGSFPGIEAFAAQKERLRDKGALYDPRVRQRIEAGGRLPADALPRLRALRAEIASEIAATLSGYDAMLYPTVPIIAPKIADLDDDETFGRINLLMLRNPTVMNFIDGCAVSLPVHAPGTAPVGLSVAGLSGGDRRILAIARRIEALVTQE